MQKTIQKTRCYPKVDWLAIGCCQCVGIAAVLFEAFVVLVFEVVAGCYFGVGHIGDGVHDHELLAFRKDPWRKLSTDFISILKPRLMWEARPSAEWAFALRTDPTVLVANGGDANDCQLGPLSSS